MVTMSGCTWLALLLIRKARNTNSPPMHQFLLNTSPACAVLLTYLILFMLLCGPSPWLPFLAAAISGKPTASALDPKFHVLCSTKYVYVLCALHLLTFHSFFRIVFHSLRGGVRSVTFDIPWTKSTRELGATVILTARRNGDPLCPVTAFKNHLDVNSSIPASSTLCAYTSPAGEPKGLPAAKSETLNPSGSVPLMSELGELRAPHNRKDGPIWIRFLTSIDR